MQQRNTLIQRGNGVLFGFIAAKYENSAAILSVCFLANAKGPLVFPIDRVQAALFSQGTCIARGRAGGLWAIPHHFATSERLTCAIRGWQNPRLADNHTLDSVVSPGG